MREPRLAAGNWLGPYEVLAPLGAGGMGEVYRARDPRIGREVAVKVVSNAEAASDSMRRLEAEARAAGALNHPNLLTVFDVGAHNGDTYVVSELLEGETLREALQRGVLPVRKAVDYATQIAMGLSAAHEKGIVHRDLKPENLFLTRDGRIKVLDFGLAKRHRPPEAPGDATGSLGGAAPNSEPGTILGTVGYISPEQVRGLPADPRSDVFALGAVLYEMLAGRRAFRGNTAVETLTAILNNDPPEVPAMRSAPAVERVIRRCLEKRPDERFQAARDVAFALEAVSTGSMAAPAPARFRRAHALAALTLLALIGFSAGSIARRSPAAPVSFTRLTFQRADIQTARFAPDGETFVYSMARELGKFELVAGRLGSPEWRSLGLPPGHVLSISPRGDLALLLEPRGRRGRLATVPLAGGAPRDVSAEVGGAGWSPKGESLAIVHSPSDVWILEFPLGREIYRDQATLSNPMVAQDGERVAFLRLPPTGRPDIGVLDRAGKKQMLSVPATFIRGLAWGPSGEEIWYATGESNGSSTLFAQHLDGGGRRVLAYFAGAATLHDVFRDGRALVSRDEERVEAFLHTASGTREVSWLDGSLAVDVSSDGTAILLSENGSAGNRSPGGLAYLRRTDGTPPIRLGEGLPLALSPDGSWAVAHRPAGNAHLVLMPTGAGAPKALPSGGLTDFGAASFFPDGKRLLIWARDAAGRRSFIQDLAGGLPRPVTPPGTSTGFPELRPLSPDGRWIIATEERERRVQLFPVDGGAPRTIPSLEHWKEIALGWSPDGRSVYVAPFAGTAGWVDRIEVATGRREHWKEINPADPAGVRYRRVALGPGGSFAVSYFRKLSELFLAEGLQ